VNVVAPESGWLAAPPESDVWLKLPSGEVSVQSVTPCVFQKIDTRVSSGTDAGTAQICTRDAAAGVVVAGGAVCWIFTARAMGAGGGGFPT
jgi:hypothetical protein